MADFKSVFMVTHERPIGRGASAPQLYLGDDGTELNLYAVKLYHNPFGPRTLLNELIGYAACDYLGVRHVQPILAEVAPELLPSRAEFHSSYVSGVSSGTIKQKFSPQPGVHVGTRWLDKDVVPALPEHLEPSHNIRYDHEGLAGIVLIDLWLCNRDRSDANSNILVKRDGSDYNFYALDWGACFGSGMWALGNLRSEFPGLEEPLEDLAGLFPYLPNISSPSYYEPYFERLLALTPSTVEEWLTQVPAEWNLNGETRDRLIECIAQRAKGLPDYCRSRFEHREDWWL